MTTILIPLFKTRLVGELSYILIFYSLPLLYFSWDHPNPIALSLVVDKLSAVLMALSVWISVIALNLNSKDSLAKLNILLLLWSLLFFFSTSSLVSFFILFEASLIPTLCLIMGWGYQPERFEASYYFMFYTIILSIPLLVSLLWLTEKTGSWHFHFESVETLSSGLGFYLLVVFIIKLPLYMGHLWLPKAHVEAPVAGSMLLAGVLLKTGGYGVVRIFLYLKKGLISAGFMSLGAIGMACMCLVCLSCVDMKQLIAYSSVSHMNFMLVGLMNNTQTSYSGGVIMMASHGLCSSLMFMLADMAYKRSGSRSIIVNKAMLLSSPAISMTWAITSILNMGVPPSAGSLSELMIISASKSFNSWYNILFVLYLFLSAFYSVYLYMCLNHGKSYMMSQGISAKEALLCVMHVVPLLGLTLMSEDLLV